jgi:hypothetical protein
MRENHDFERADDRQPGSLQSFVADAFETFPSEGRLSAGRDRGSESKRQRRAVGKCLPLRVEARTVGAIFGFQFG